MSCDRERVMFKRLNRGSFDASTHHVLSPAASLGVQSVDFLALAAFKSVRGFARRSAKDRRSAKATLKFVHSRTRTKCSVPEPFARLPHIALHCVDFGQPHERRNPD